MRAATKLSLALALTSVIAVTAVIATDASGQTGPTVITLTVPLQGARAHGTDVAPKGPSPGDGFQESYVPAHPGELRRQDAIGIGTFGRGVFLGTITLKQGQIVYAGSTNNQDNTTYAIVGGTGSYQGARGTMSTHSLPHARLQITIAINP